MNKIKTEKPTGKLNVCCDCGEPGGTLVKAGDEYRHSNPSWCKTLKKLAKGMRPKNRKERRVKEKK